MADLGTPLKLIGELGDLVQRYPLLSSSLALGIAVALGALALLINMSRRWASGSAPAETHSETLSPALRAIENYVGEILTERPGCALPWPRIAAALIPEQVFRAVNAHAPVDLSSGYPFLAEITAWAGRHDWGVEWNGQSATVVITRHRDPS